MDNLRLGIWLCLGLLVIVSPIRLDRCELAGQLYILDVPKAELGHWLCIADFESRFNTHVIGNGNVDGSRDYGIFQISDRFWCDPPEETPYYAFNGCNVNCSALLTNDITSAVLCARLIRKQQGWGAWSVYEEFCNGTKLDNAEECFGFNSLEAEAEAEETTIGPNFELEATTIVTEMN
ncbi:lysozyme 1B [Drosophila grimshawi]|uniref:lysozyme 1B n=1 Tax=Drosophila grimshawi TaxID=7222 RepID=UPI000C86F19B|nr:lysozyme 1B [Drosophila grimshawi]